MNINLNKRLTNLSAFINKNDRIIDIGCDHGLLGIYLYNKLGIRVISSDLRSEPLKIARNNLEKYHLTDKITIKQGNGLESMEDDINTVIISGMGGETINKILSDINNYNSVKKIVISPNNDFIDTRKYISKLGFCLVKEEIVIDNDKYYLISEYNKGYNKIDYYFGKLDLNNECVINYYRNIYNKNKMVINKLPIRKIIKKINLILENKKIIRNVNIKDYK